MAEYLTNTVELTAVANAIREKGGTSEQLAYPGGFVSAIQAIQTGAPSQIIVTTSAGATVTATKDGKTVSGTADTNGKCILTVTEAGTWTVTAATASATKTSDVVVGISNVDLTLVNPVFGNNSWAAIIKACQKKQVPDTWNVGDSCSMTINNKTYAIDIIGKNHDDYADGSGKAPLTFMLHTSYAQLASMQPDRYSNNNWVASHMRKTYLPSMLRLMPNEVQTGIKEVNKATGKGDGSAETVVSSEKLFLLSAKEVFNDKSGNQTNGEGTQYEYFTRDIDNRCHAKIPSTDSSIWWLRSPARNTGGTSTYYDFLVVYEDINTSEADLTFTNCANNGGVSFAFCF